PAADRGRAAARVSAGACGGAPPFPRPPGRDAMIHRLSGSPLRGKYLVRNRLVNRVLRLADGLLGLAAPARPPAEAVRPRRLLLANGAHLGDVLLSLAVLPVLHRAFPRARFGFLCGSWARCVPDRHALVSWVHVVDHWKLNRAPLPLGQKVAHH